MNKYKTSKKPSTQQSDTFCVLMFLKHCQYGNYNSIYCSFHSSFEKDISLYERGCLHQLRKVFISGASLSLMAG